MLGSRYLGASQSERMRGLTLRLAALGLITGIGAAGAMGAGRETLIRAFTRDGETAAQLRAAWPLLCALQPINALVFVYDGLLYATMSFR